MQWDLVAGLIVCGIVATFAGWTIDAVYNYLKDN